MTTTTLLSQRAHPRCCGRGFYLESLIGSGLERIPRVRCDKAKRGCASRVPASRVPASPGAPHGRGEGGGSDPPFLAAGAAPASVHRRTQWRTINTPLERGRSLHSDPCGKAVESARKSARRTAKPGSRGDGSSPGGDRGSPGACGPEPGRGSLCPLGPVRAKADVDGRVGALRDPREVGGFGHPITKRPVEPDGGVGPPGATS